METPTLAIETTGTLDAQGQLHLDGPIRGAAPGPVRVIVLLSPEEPSEADWLRAASGSGAFDFLRDDAEDLYSAADGVPFRG
jgi:hypothetical protein